MVNQDHYILLIAISYLLQWGLGVLGLWLAILASIRLAGGGDYGTIGPFLAKTVFLPAVFALPALFDLPTLFSLSWLGAVYLWIGYGLFWLPALFLVYRLDGKEARTLWLLHWPIAVALSLFVFFPLMSHITNAIEERDRAAIEQR